MAAPDKFLLEAMREVDALYPDTPPIAPPSEVVLVGASLLNVRTNRWITDLHAPPLPPRRWEPKPTPTPRPGEPRTP